MNANTPLTEIMVRNALTGLMNDAYLMKVTRELMEKERVGPNPANDTTEGYVFTDDDVRRRILEECHDEAVNIAEDLSRDMAEETGSVVADSAYEQADPDGVEIVARAQLAFMSDGQMLQWFEEIPKTGTDLEEEYFPPDADEMRGTA